MNFLESGFEVVAAGIFRESDCRQCRPTSLLACFADLSVICRSWDTHIFNRIQTTIESLAVTVLRLPGGSEEYVGILAPVLREDSAYGVVCLVGVPRRLRELVLLAQLIAAEQSGVLQLPQATNAEESAGDRLLQLAVRYSAAGDWNGGCESLADELKQELKCDAFLMGVRPRWRQKCQLQSASGVAPVRPHSPLAACVDEVLNEAQLLDGPERLDVSNGAARPTRGLQRFAELCQANTVLFGPIRDSQGTAVGGWACFYREPATERERPLPSFAFARMGDDLSARLGQAHIALGCWPPARRSFA